jgi:hypothetical protein
MKQKSTIKIVAAITIVLGFALTTMGQNPVTGDITAHANVIAALAVSQQQTLEFGQVIPSYVTKTVSTTGVATVGTGNVSSQGVQQGIGKIVKATGTSITYKLNSPPANLTFSSNNLAIGSYVTAYSLTTTGGTQTSGNATVTLPTTVPSGSETDVYVHIGATVSPISNQAIGLYTGTITLSAEYN